MRNVDEQNLDRCLGPWYSDYCSNVVASHDWQIIAPGFQCFGDGREGGKRNGGVAPNQGDCHSSHREDILEDTSAEATLVA